MRYTADRRTGSNVRFHRWAILAGLLAGFALRLYQLGAESLWYDETVSVYLARQPVNAMLAHTAGDIHPPGYYLLLHLWQSITHPTLAHGLEFLYAWPSLWWGMLLLPLLYVLGRKLFNPRAGLIALWLAAINPFQLWYSQEVRMYTLGAALGLLCLWATLQFLLRRNPVRWLAVYAVSAAAGLYTLYYFALLLAGLNLIALLWLWREHGRTTGVGRQAVRWLVAQGAVLLLWLPWLPVFWRQATEPPVPPWRTPWIDPASVVASLAETFAAPLVGQSPPGVAAWPWAIASLLVIAASVAVAIVAGTQSWDNKMDAARPYWVIGLYVFVPVTLLYVITALITPLYHVRYLFIYSVPFVLLIAAVIDAVAARHAWLAVLMGVGFAAVSLLSLREMWASPHYRADDHRSAVAQLARDWRPGDVILANAGWIYPILDTYWPTSADDAGDALPPPVAAMPRVIDYAQFTGGLTLDAPVVVRTGSVDGDASLGWGKPSADFFAVSRAQTLDALAALATNYPRIWHYRLYDTVSDPAGVIRSWLASETAPLLERPIPGRDFGLVQLFATGTARPSADLQTEDTTFGDALRLVGHTLPVTATAGSQLYTDLHWQALPALPDLPVDLSMSLRLYDEAGQMVAQADGPPWPATSTWVPGQHVVQAAALPVRAGTPPGDYSVDLIVYRQDDGTPLPLPDGSRTVDGQRWRLGTVTVGK